MNELEQNKQAPAAPNGGASDARENIMGTMPMNPLLIKLSVPMIISMLVQALYNVVDSIFISRVSEEALAAVSLAFSIQNFMIALGVGIGVGVNVLVSRSLGEQNPKKAQRVANNGVFLALCSCAVMMVFALLFVTPYFTAQTSDAEIIREGTNYLFLCCLFSQGLFVQMIMEKLLAATGNTKHGMICQLSGAVVNIILDPIFIFGYCGSALSGARGAAIATVIGQWVAALVGLYFCQYKRSPLKLRAKGFVPDDGIVRAIFTVGGPSILMVSVGSVMVLGVNQILLTFSATAVAFFGVYYRLQSFVFMPIFGMNNAVMPILGYNYGARKPSRIVHCLKLSFLYAQGIMVLGLLVFVLFPAQLLEIFDASEIMLAIGVPALKIIALSYLFAGINMIASTAFQALGFSMYSFYLSLLRQVFILLPVAYLLSLTGKITLVWWAFPMAEGICFVLVALLLVRVYRKAVVPMAAQG